MPGSISAQLRRDAASLARLRSTGLGFVRKDADVERYVAALNIPQSKKPSRVRNRRRRLLPAHNLGNNTPPADARIDYPIPQQWKDVPSDPEPDTPEQDGNDDPATRARNLQKQELVRVILIKGSARDTGVRRLKELHLNSGADDDFIRAVESGEKHIDPENFAFFFAADMPAKEAIKTRYNREVIASVASYAYRVANADPTRYGYWPKRAYFRCAVEKVYRILVRWDSTQYKPGETKEALIQRIVDNDLDALAKARIRSSRHTVCPSY
ncbi:hypothetical protein HDZ31DRAFT_70650 [Schizophyllum fasciatum]